MFSETCTIGWRLHKFDNISDTSERQNPSHSDTKRPRSFASCGSVLSGVKWIFVFTFWYIRCMNLACSSKFYGSFSLWCKWIIGFRVLLAKCYISSKGATWHLLKYATWILINNDLGTLKFCKDWDTHIVALKLNSNLFCYFGRNFCLTSW